MKNLNYSSNKGFSLVEVLLAISLFSILATVFVSSLIDGQESERLASERARAVFLAEEGLEAVRNIRDENFSALVPGDYGLAISGNEWIFSGSSDATEIFNRSVNITDVDANTKKVTADVTWQQNEQRNGIVSLVSYLTDWREIRLTEAEQLDVDTIGVDLDSVDPSRVIGITIENISTGSDITLDQIILSWSGALGGTKAQEISIDTGIVWSGSSGSGDTIDITDFILLQGAGPYNIDYFDFSKDMTSTTITIVFIMSDGSTKQVVVNPGGPPDATSPADITDLATLNPTGSSIDLTWTAPGDDGNTGTASSYDIRYSTSNITDANWDLATQVSGEPAPSIAGSSESMTVAGLSASTPYFFAIKTSDEIPNESGLSNIANETTTSPPQANYLLVDVTNIAINSGDSSQVIGITLQNSGASDITISSMTVSWSGVSASIRINGIGIDGSSVWTGSEKTGIIEDITDIILISGAGAVPLNYLDFNNDITGINMDITFTMSDGSSKTVSGLQPVVSAPSDVTAPADITDLATLNPTGSSIDLTWTAPGDDGNTGTASSYDIRYSTSNITDANWDLATQVSGEPAPSIAGSSESMTVAGLSASTPYFFAIKTSDEIPNESGLSNIASGTTTTPAQADYLIVNVSGMSINPGDDSQIIGMTLQNSGASNITISSMTVSWSGVSPSSRLTAIVMDGSFVWTGLNKSGNLADITDTTLISGAVAIPVDYFDFSKSASGITMDVTFTMSDGSSRVVSNIQP